MKTIRRMLAASFLMVAAFTRPEVLLADATCSEIEVNCEGIGGQYWQVEQCANGWVKFVCCLSTGCGWYEPCCNDDENGCGVFNQQTCTW